MDKEQAIKLGKKYKVLVSEHFDVKDAILYGSYSKGTHREDSDIDIAIVVDDLPGDYFDNVPLLWKIKRQVSNFIEPILICENKDKSGFLKEIRKAGIVL